MGRLAEIRARYSRTWQNKDLGQGDLLLNTYDGWTTNSPQLTWLGSDQWGPPGDFWGNKGAAEHSLGWGAAQPAIARATSLIVDTLAGSPWLVKRGLETLPTPRWVADPQLSRPDMRISEFDPDLAPMDVMAFRSQLLISALWWGDGFIWVPTRDLDGQPKPPLFVLNPADVTIILPGNQQGLEPGYYVGDSPEWVRLTSPEIIHMRGQGPYLYGRGLGVLDRFASTWADNAAVNRYSAGIYTAGIPAGYLQSSAPNMTQEQAELLKAKWADAHGGGQRSIAVLNSVTTFTPIQFPPEATQMIEQKKMGILDVANAFGVEPFMLGLPSDGSTYANLESRMRAFAQFSLLPWARRIEAALNREFPLGTDLVVDLDTLAKADLTTRADFYTSGLAAGWMTVDEVRAEEGLGPVAALPDSGVV